VELGHRKIAFIAGPEGLHSAESRKIAFLDAMKLCRLKVPESSLYISDHKLEGRMAGMRYFLEQGDLPTAVVCSNDMTAIGVLHAAAEAKLRIPRDLSIIGFGAGLAVPARSAQNTIYVRGSTGMSVGDTVSIDTGSSVEPTRSRRRHRRFQCYDAMATAPRGAGHHHPRRLNQRTRYK
jgi:hypothetical protein